MRILIAAGGTGGHIYPALAVVSQLTKRQPDLQLRWMGGHRGLEGDIVPAAGLPLERLWLRSLRTVDASLNTLLDPLRLLASIPQAAWRLLRWRPDAIYTTGGYVAIPVLAAAALLRVPSLIWEGNAIPGRSVRVSGRLADVRAVAFAASQDRLPSPTYVTGTPIRELAGIDPAGAARRLGLPEGLPVLLVFGGSQSVRRLDEAMAGAIAALVERCVVVHITGQPSFARAAALRETLPSSLRDRYRPFAFLHDEMAEALACADLLVGRAGSSTLAEATAAGLPMIVVPYPHAAAHQRANADELVRAGGAVLVPDEELDADALRRAVDLLGSPQLSAMADASRSLGRPGAATVNADLLLALATRAPLPEPGAVEADSRAVS
jgi:UDP-N-acetylglucosamine--N-acetylmuramyl-(pentapeptide) pyrophosphoryl-undecaprenol N-acetylglucosamine transferase